MSGNSMRGRCGNAAWKRVAICLVPLLMSMLPVSPTEAEPWIEVGDRALRSDIEILAAAHLVDGPLTTWPMPAGQLSRLSDNLLLAREPEYVQLAAKRVLDRLIGEGQPRGLTPRAAVRATNDPNTIRDFGSVARDKVDGSAGLTWDTTRFSAGLRVGMEPRQDKSDSRVALDGSYLSILLDNWQLYGGWVDKWYGPGWISSLTLSNNARPLPKIGIMRNDTRPFETPWLSWLGPWQFDTFFGVLDGPRVATNTLLGALRFSFQPIRNLEVALTRTSEVCGRGHQCNPLTEEFHFRNTAASPSPSNDEATIDFKYTVRLGGVSWSPYFQAMNEDSGPFTHANTSYLVGSSLAGRLGSNGAQWRVVAEYTDTLATLNWFNFGKLNHGAAYNDGKYPDGMRYRGRTLGFSLDSDSRLFSLAGMLTDAHGWSYRLTYYRANINSEQLAGIQPVVYPDQAYAPGIAFNSVSARPVQINQFEAGISIPWHPFHLDVTVREQDAQAYPEHGSRVAAEAGLGYRF